ncbi:MAG: Clp1/GlmU family protein [Actinomycetota bacterium]
MDDHDALVERAAASAHTVALVGGLDAGKTTIAKSILRAAAEAGRMGALVDADVAQPASGPPATVGLKLIRSPHDIEPEGLAHPDSLQFVGSSSPQGHLLQVVAGTGRSVARAKQAGADIVVVDTSGLVSGLEGQSLKYHKFELIQPDLVVGLQRGGELEPLLGIVQRFFDAEVVSLPVHPSVVPTTPDQRVADRVAAFTTYFSGSLQRWRVKPTVFMPAVPPLFDLAQLDRLLVGLSDGAGAYLGLGYLEYAADEGVMRLVSPVAEAPRALRLGSVRLDEGFDTRRVDLNGLFGTT